MFIEGYHQWKETKVKWVNIKTSTEFPSVILLCF